MVCQILQGFPSIDYLQLEIFTFKKKNTLTRIIIVKTTVIPTKLQIRDIRNVQVKKTH